MQTIKLNISDHIYDEVVAALSAFDKEEVVIISEDTTFNANKIYLHNELNEIENGKASFISHNELEDSLNQMLSKYETNL